MAIILDNVSSRFYNALDHRAETQEQLKQFAINNPKLAAFLSIQLVLTGIPLVLFVAFAVTVTVCSLVVALLLGVLAAVLFTGFVVGGALLVVLPVLFFTTFAASFLFLWGLSGYAILQWFTGGETRADRRRAVGDRINALTNGRMKWLGDGSKEDRAGVSGIDPALKMDSGIEMKLDDEVTPKRKHNDQDTEQGATLATDLQIPNGPTKSGETDVVETTEGDTKDTAWPLPPVASS